jgi:riboflavin synthase alpha subunit
MLAPKGSVAIDGVSLTVNAVGSAAPGGVVFDVALVPHTLAATRLAQLRPTAHVNVEVDVLARYVARQLGQPGSQRSGAMDADESRLLEKLGAGGFL